MLQEADLYVMHGGTSNDGGRGPSPSIWGRGNPASPPGRAEGGLHIFDDFLSFNGILTTNDGVYYSDQGHYATWAEASSTLLGIASGTTSSTGRGVIRSTPHTDANDDQQMAYGNGTQDLGVISGVAADQRKTLFECRVRRDTIEANDSAMFCGLASPGEMAANALDDTTGALKATGDFIGFYWDGNAQTDDVDFAFQAASGTQDLGVADLIAKTDGVSLLSATPEFLKLGFVYDPYAPVGDFWLRIFVNGIEVKGYGVTKSEIVDSADASHADWPDVGMTFLWALKNIDGSSVADLDWWRFYQEGE